MLKSCLLIFILPSLLFANPWDQIPAGLYKVQEKTTLEKILIEKFHVPAEYLVFEKGEENLITKIKEMNPHIKKWDTLPKGSSVYIELPKNASYQKFHDSNYLHIKNATHASSDYLKKKIRERKKIAKRPPPRKKIKVFLAVDEKDLETEEEIQNYLKEKQNKKELNKKLFPIGPANRFGLFGFYSISQGSFSETVTTQGVSGKNDQNSPATLGLGFHFKLRDDRWYSASAYYSYLNTSAANQLDEIVEIPPEFGFNVYFNMAMSFPGLSFYWGMDRESFSTFNLEELQSGELLKTRTQTNTYLTFGFSQYFTLWKELFLLKASYSPIFWAESNPKSTISDEDYGGSKYIVYLNYFYAKSYSLFGFYKVHNLKGPSDLNISRMGLGISKTFF